VSRCQKSNTNLDFCEARDSEWQWHQLGRMQVCTSLQPDNHASTPLLSFLQAGRPSCRQTNSVKAQKAQTKLTTLQNYMKYTTQTHTEANSNCDTDEPKKCKKNKEHCAS